MNNSFAIVPDAHAQQETLDSLASEHIAAKKALAQAQSDLDAVNQRIADAVGAKPEGAFSVEGDHYKITTTQPVARRFADEKLARDLWMSLPKDTAEALIQWKPSLSVKVYKELEKYQPETFAKISRVVTSKPGKTAVKVEVLS